MAGGASGPAVMACQPDASLLFQKISMDRPPMGARMPFGGQPLPPGTQDLIHTWIAEGARASCDDADPCGDDMPPMFVPLQQLEDLAPNTWYVNVLATYPKHRGKGYGRELLSIAEQLAKESRSTGLSLIVSDGNSGARRLYERIGFREVASRPMVKESWQNPGRDWVLLLKDL